MEDRPSGLGDAGRYPKETLRHQVLRATPSVVQCQTCGLAFNTGLAGINDYSHYAFCGNCGVSHIVCFRNRGGKIFRSHMEYDTEGPRVIPVVGEYSSKSDTLDVILSSPVAAPDAMQLCGKSSIDIFDTVLEMFATLRCGACNANDIRHTFSENASCPKCRDSTLQNVGGWI